MKAKRATASRRAVQDPTRASFDTLGFGLHFGYPPRRGGLIIIEAMQMEKEHDWGRLM